MGQISDKVKAPLLKMNVRLSLIRFSKFILCKNWAQASILPQSLHVINSMHDAIHNYRTLLPLSIAIRLCITQQKLSTLTKSYKFDTKERATPIQREHNNRRSVSLKELLLANGYTMKSNTIIILITFVLNHSNKLVINL